MSRIPMTYHAGASGWTLTVGRGASAAVYDIKAMTPHDRGRFFFQLRGVLKERYRAAS